MKSDKTYAPVLTIAGSDSISGAGLQADLKAIHNLGGYGLTAVTAITAQNTMRVATVMAVPSKFLLAQLMAIIDDITPMAIKTGMIPTMASGKVISKFIKTQQKAKIVIDPVLFSGNGAVLAKDMVSFFLTHLFPFADCITPNIPEAVLLSNALGGKKFYEKNISTIDDMKKLCILLSQTGCKSVLLKGGHLWSGFPMDMLYIKNNNECIVYKHERLSAPNNHGTGCALASAIATLLAGGLDIKTSVQQAIDYIQCALIKSTTVKIGKGNGSLIQ